MDSVNHFLNNWGQSYIKCRFRQNNASLSLKSIEKVWEVLAQGMHYARTVSNRL